MDYKDFGFTVEELRQAMITLNKMSKNDIMKTLENKQYLIELSDEEYQIIDRKELLQAEQSAEDFDGFLGFTVIDTIDNIKNKKISVNKLKDGIRMGLGSQGIWTPELENIILKEMGINYL